MNSCYYVKRGINEVPAAKESSMQFGAAETIDESSGSITTWFKQGHYIHFNNLKIVLQLKLLQRGLAEILGTCEDTITGWESNRYRPHIQFASGIIRFLGYNPYPFETKTLGGRIKYYRFLHGLSHKKFGTIFVMHATTVGAWDAETSPPRADRLEQLNSLLKSLPKEPS